MNMRIKMMIEVEKTSSPVFLLDQRMVVTVMMMMMVLKLDIEVTSSPWARLRTLDNCDTAALPRAAQH